MGSSGSTYERRCKDADKPSPTERQRLAVFRAAVDAEQQALRKFHTKLTRFEHFLPASRHELLKPYCDAVDRCEELVAEMKHLVDEDARNIRERISRPAGDGPPTYAQITGVPSGEHRSYLEAVAAAEHHERSIRKHWQSSRSGWELMGPPPQSSRSDAIIPKSLGKALLGLESSFRHFAELAPDNISFDVAPPIIDDQYYRETTPATPCAVEDESHLEHDRVSTRDSTFATLQGEVSARNQQLAEQSKISPLYFDQLEEFEADDMPGVLEVLRSYEVLRTVSTPGLGSISIPPYTTSFRVVAVHRSDAVEPGDLSFKAGQIIVVVTILDDNWYRGIYMTLDGRHGTLHAGVFPKTYVERLHRPGGRPWYPRRPSGYWW